MKPLTRAAATAAALAVLLAGCGGDPTAEPDPSASPAEPDFAVTHDRWHDLLDAGKAVNTAQQAINAASKKFLDADPAGDLSDPAIAEPLADLDEAIADRDSAIEELASDPAVNTPELKEAWHTLAPVNAKFNTEVDGYFRSQPLLQKGLRGCGALFDKMKQIELAGVFGESKYHQERYRVYQSGAATCFAPMEQLASSGNSEIATYASGWFAIHQKRLALLERAAGGELGMKKMRDRYVALGEEEAKLSLDPQAQFNKLSPRTLMAAFDKALHAAPGVPSD